MPAYPAIAQRGREIRVTLSGPGGAGGAVVLTDYDSSRGVESARGLDVDFVAQLYSEPQPQPLEVVVFGLAARVRDQLSEVVESARELAYRTRTATRVGQVRVEAGRPGLRALLAAAEIYEVDHARDGADWRTVIRGADGRAAWASGFVSGSVSGFTDPTRAAAALQRSLGITVDEAGTTTAGAAPDLVAQGFAGFAGGFDAGLFGASAAANQRMLGALGRRPIWVRGQLRWTRPDLADLRPAVVLREGATLLELGKPGEYGVRTARAQLDPLFEPGRQVLLVRPGGTPLAPYPFRVDGVRHRGSSYAEPWDSELTLRPSPRVAIDPFAV